MNIIERKKSITKLIRRKECKINKLTNEILVLKNELQSLCPHKNTLNIQNSSGIYTTQSVYCEDCDTTIKQGTGFNVLFDYKLADIIHSRGN